MSGTSIERDGAERRSLVIARALLCLAIIACGLTLRGFGLGVGLPTLIVKYGGSILWGTMVFLLVAVVASGQSPRHITAISAVIAVSVELSGWSTRPGWMISG